MARATLAAAEPRVQPGGNASLSLVVTNPCRQPVRDVTAVLHAPAGWTVSAPVAVGTLAKGASKTVPVTVTRGASTPVGQHSVLAEITGNTGVSTAFTTAAVALEAVPRAPSGTVAVSTLDFLAAQNGWGPVERDRSNGEAGDGDGRTITIGGTTHPTGLGVHADSTVDVYAGGRCTRLVADVGVDDETGARGSMTFEVWRDGVRAWTSARLTGADGAEKADVDVSGAQVVRLRALDGGDGNGGDHGDWAGATLTCAA
jgi:beta-galactosidase